MNNDSPRAFTALLDAFVAANGPDATLAEAALRRGFRAGLSPVRAREAMRMVHLFGGFPRTLNALEAFERAAKASLQKTPPAGSRDRLRAAKGSKSFYKIYSSQAEAVTNYLRRLDKNVAIWIEEHAYARVLSRPDLTILERELLAIAALAATCQHKQLTSHALGARRCGAGELDILRALARGLRAAPRNTHAPARAAVRKALQKASTRK